MQNERTAQRARVLFMDPTPATAECGPAAPESKNKILFWNAIRWELPIGT